MTTPRQPNKGWQKPTRHGRIIVPEEAVAFEAHLNLPFKLRMLSAVDIDVSRGTLVKGWWG